MKILYKKIKCRGERGQSIVELGLGITLIAIVAILVLKATGINLSGVFGGVSDRMGKTRVLQVEPNDVLYYRIDGDVLYIKGQKDDTYLERILYDDTEKSKNG